MITVPVMGRRQRWTYRLLLAIWMTSVILFGVFWFRSANVDQWWSFAVTTAVVGYSIAMPGYFFYFLGRMRTSHPALRPPSGLRVAIATTFVPGSESVAVLEKTLVAMLGQEGWPHDVWVLDEGRTAAVRNLCDRLDARYFSRQGIPYYQAASWPFQRKTKAGNYNAFLDVHGEEYDVLIQMDTDHVPQPGYMMEMLKPFGDPAVSYVAAPSIVNANAAASWVVRARYETEATLHGALQMGYTGSYAPLIIGSHAAFRIEALRSIGGFQRTLAEDHHNTLRLNAAGFRGVFAPYAIAIGDGAESFEGAMTQEYQWARALTQILFRFLRHDFRALPWRMKIQFLFAQTWYPAFAITQAIGWLMAPVTLITGVSWVKVDLWAFWGSYGLTVASAIMIVAWVRRQGWLRPGNARWFSLGTAGLMLARWPFVLWAVLDALIGTLTKKEFPFRVTTKGQVEEKPLPVRMLLPFVALLLFSATALAVYHFRPRPGVSGYWALTVVGLFIYAAFLWVVVGQNHRDNRQATTSRRAWALHTRLYGALSLMVLLGLLACSLRPPSISSQATTIVVPPALPGGAVAQTMMGAYDPHGELSTRPMELEEVFVQWKPAIQAELTTDLAAIAQRGRIPVVVVEPYAWNINGLTTATLLPDISTGRYDPAIRGIALAVAGVKGPVYIRFAHEMDGAWYPWSGSPALYVAAYRHFVETVRLYTANVKWIWSPVNGAAPATRPYFPGADVVDFVGATILFAKEWYPESSLRLADVMRTNLKDVGSVYGKPLIVCEAAVSAPASIKTEWVRDFAHIGQYPGVVGLIYFNDQQPPGFSTTRPDWRLSSADADILFPTSVKGARNR